LITKLKSRRCIKRSQAPTAEKKTEKKYLKKKNKIKKYIYERNIKEILVLLV